MSTDVSTSRLRRLRANATKSRLWQQSRKQYGASQSEYAQPILHEGQVADLLLSLSYMVMQLHHSWHWGPARVAETVEDTRMADTSTVQKVTAGDLQKLQLALEGAKNEREKMVAEVVHLRRKLQDAEYLSEELQLALEEARVKNEKMEDAVVDLQGQLSEQPTDPGYDSEKLRKASYTTERMTQEDYEAKKMNQDGCTADEVTKSDYSAEGMKHDDDDANTEKVGSVKGALMRILEEEKHKRRQEKLEEKKKSEDEDEVHGSSRSRVSAKESKQEETKSRMKVMNKAMKVVKAMKILKMKTFQGNMR
jgi:hypothetical protein